MEYLLAGLVNTAALLIVTLGFYKHWQLSKGASRLRRVYWLNIVTGTLNFMVNGLIVIRDPSVWGILSFQAVILWSIAMSIKGLLYGEVPSRERLE